MLVGDTQRFALTDDQYQPRLDVVWTLSDNTIASITSDASPVLTAIGVGQVTLTATVGALSAQVEVNVLGGTALPAGSVRWSVPPISTGFAMRVRYFKPSRFKEHRICLFSRDWRILMAREMMRPVHSLRTVVRWEPQSSPLAAT